MQTQTMAVLRTVFSFLVVATSWAFTNTSTPDKREPANLQSPSYSVESVVSVEVTEHRFKLNNRHFGTLIDLGGTYAFRPRPGCDINGWGSTWYGQPFLPDAELKHTTIEPIQADSSGIYVSALGMVSRGQSDTYGTWSSDIRFTYDPTSQIITGTGQYTITLAGPLSITTGDLNLYKIASNYLDDVPLLSGAIGDTGDMEQANVVGNSSGYTWIPTDQPSHFPTDKTDFLSIEVVGQFNNVDTQAMGFAPIAAAYKPGLKISLASQQANADMMFGAIYDLSESQCFYCDNVGITPLISKASLETEFHYDIVLEGLALETCAYLPLIKVDE